MDNLNRQAIERLKEQYIHSELTALELAQISADLVGQEVSVDTIRYQIKRESWQVLRAAARAETDADEGSLVVDELSQLRRLYYQQIIASTQEGLLVTGQFDRDEFHARLADLDGIEIISFSPRGIDHNDVNAYMNLLTKSGVEISVRGISAKTGRQQAIELVGALDSGDIS